MTILFSPNLVSTRLKISLWILPSPSSASWIQKRISSLIPLSLTSVIRTAGPVGAAYWVALVKAYLR